jgi:hypothetical protein
MKKLMVLMFSVATLALSAALAHADTIDPLHGFCGTTASGTTCTDNGTITPSNNLSQFGFWASPAPQTGTDLITILISNTIAGSSSETFSLMEHLGNGNETVSSTNDGLWTSGDLSTFLAAQLPGTTSPSNPIGAFEQPGCPLCPAGTTGFWVYTFNFGSETLNGNGVGDVNPWFSFAGGNAFPQGGIITDFLIGSNQNPATNNTATAPSGALLLTDHGTPGVPEPASLLLLGSGLGLAGFRMRRKK